MYRWKEGKCGEASSQELSRGSPSLSALAKVFDLFGMSPLIRQMLLGLPRNQLITHMDVHKKAQESSHDKRSMYNVSRRFIQCELSYVHTGASTLIVILMTIFQQPVGLNFSQNANP